jgi:hypothetical protein
MFTCFYKRFQQFDNKSLADLKLPTYKVKLLVSSQTGSRYLLLSFEPLSHKIKADDRN